MKQCQLKEDQIKEKIIEFPKAQFLGEVSSNSCNTSHELL